MAHRVYVTAVEQKGKSYYFTMYEKAKIQSQKIPELMKKFNGELSIKADTSNPCFVYERKGKNKKDKSSDALSVVKNVLIEMKGLLEP